MKKVLLAAAISLSLAGCATAPQDFQQHMNNAVDDVGIVGNGAVSIVTEVTKAVLAVAAPISQIFSLATSVAGAL